MNNGNRSLLYLKPEFESDTLSNPIRSKGWEVHGVSQVDSALETISQEHFQVGLVRWDEYNEEEITDQTERVIHANPLINWVAVLPNETGSFLNLSQVIASYFYDYHTLPLDLDRLLITLGHAYGMAKIAETDTVWNDDTYLDKQIVGDCPKMRDLFRKIQKVANIDLTVLIRGESGTGKELTAQAIHELSNRSDKPFVTVNCGALPKELIQSELFGHEKGAFTGADKQRIGRIEAANEGTIFLDEIGDLPLEQQVNLLRFLQEKTITRIGSHEEHLIDTRVIAATNVDLEKAVEAGQFREDLYYRLNVLRLETPPLRERAEDIELLANFIFKRFAEEQNKQLVGFSRQALDAIKSYEWPGNVRELVNRIQGAVVMSEGKLIGPKELGLDLPAPNTKLMTLAAARAAAEKQAIETTLGVTRNNVSQTARRLKISRVTLYRLMELYSIDWQGARSEQ
ncbi:MAG: sigma-54 dependent transcriptional regulator [Chromatiales bacterium]|nr:sigma-54 dependent transcriptional regulator [Chromatiales bacterium]